MLPYVSMTSTAFGEVLMHALFTTVQNLTPGPSPKERGGIIHL
jgi:hypothetical protein